MQSGRTEVTEKARISSVLFVQIMKEKTNTATFTDQQASLQTKATRVSLKGGHHIILQPINCHNDWNRKIARPALDNVKT